MKRLSMSIVALIAVFTTTSFATADEYSRIVNEATKIQDKSAILLDETKHYRRATHYNDLVRYVYEQNRLAARVQAIAVREGNIYRLDAELNRLDGVFHQVENLFDEIEEHALHGHGFVKGDTRHVKSLLNAVERCIHKMQNDVKKIRRRAEKQDHLNRSHYTTTRSGYNSGCYNSGYRTSYNNSRYGYNSGYRYTNGSNRNRQVPHGYGKYGSTSGITFGNDRVSFRFDF